MIYRESRPFENNAEYRRFTHNWCEKCKSYKLGSDGLPPIPCQGGCGVLDAVELANLDIDWFPKKDIIEEVYDTVDVVSRRICKRFESI